MTVYAQHLAQFVEGFALSLGLIMAIGAQNVFVLTQGARGHRPLFVAAVCTACDVLLIALGVGGVGALAARQPWLATTLTLGGVAFLCAYGLRALRSAVRGERLALDLDAPRPDVRTVLLSALAVSLLNPHALLDTVVLIGGLAARLDVGGKVSFGVGAAMASGLWFCALSLGGRILAPVLQKPLAWRVLDAGVCLTMWALAANLAAEWLGRWSGVALSAAVWR